MAVLKLQMVTRGMIARDQARAKRQVEKEMSLPKLQHLIECINIEIMNFDGTYGTKAWQGKSITQIGVPSKELEEESPRSYGQEISDLKLPQQPDPKGNLIPAGKEKAMKFENILLIKESKMYPVDT